MDVGFLLLEMVLVLVVPVLVVLVVVVGLRWASVVVVMVVLVLGRQMMMQWVEQELLRVPNLEQPVGPLIRTFVA